MNKPRRAQIAKAVDLLKEAQSMLESAKDEEQGYYDNMPESIQGGARGDEAQEWIDLLDQATANVEHAISDIEDRP